MFRNVGTVNSDAEESPKRKNTTFTTLLLSCLELGAVILVRTPTAHYWTVTDS